MLVANAPIEFHLTIAIFDPSWAAGKILKIKLII
jgi:hypothetical protein